MLLTLFPTACNDAVYGASRVLAVSTVTIQSARPSPPLSSATARVPTAPVELIPRALQKLVPGPDGKQCRYTIEYLELRSGDPKLDRALNRKLAPAASDIHCTTDDVIWDGDNALMGNGEPAPAIFNHTGTSTVHYNDHGLLSIQVGLWAEDTGLARRMTRRDDLSVLDLHALGRELPLSEVIDRKRNPEAWTSRVGEAVKRALTPDLSTADWMTTACAEADRYTITNTGVALCPTGLPSVIAALETCSYIVTWGELEPFWIAGNPLERVRGK